MTKYKNEKVVIVGLGLTGLSCVSFFLARGVIPRVMDSGCSPTGLRKLPDNIPRQIGSLNKAWLLDATLIVISPGISLSHPMLTAAAAAGITIVGDIELFAREVSCPVVAITGSNGKSTVTRMVSEMVSAAGFQVSVGGNIGFPALMLLNSPKELYVLELSSFQLETTKSLKAAVATVLNISEDHMNRYSFNLQKYKSAKLKIYQNAGVCVVNSDDKQTFPISGRSNIPLISFGDKNSDYYLNRDKNKTCLMKHGELLLDCAEMTINGYHNYLNALAALALVDAINIPINASLTALRQFCSLPHRFELVHNHRGVRWINDSKATNVGSTKAALSELRVLGTLHLLLGGDGKSADFKSLTPAFQGGRIRLYCFGKDGKKLASLRPDISTLTETLEQSMRIIGTQVRTGDAVMLSPACSSLDQFINFEVRGQMFTLLAREIG